MCHIAGIKLSTMKASISENKESLKPAFGYFLLNPSDL